MIAITLFELKTKKGAILPVLGVLLNEILLFL